MKFRAWLHRQWLLIAVLMLMFRVSAKGWAADQDWSLWGAVRGTSGQMSLEVTVKVFHSIYVIFSTNLRDDKCQASSSVAGVQGALSPFLLQSQSPCS